jgi:glycosyltransferase involved in cell wall biosynthesis
MKVDFIISSLGGGGAERVLALMVNSLAKNPSNQISVVTLFDKNEDYELDPAIKRIKLKQFNFLPSHTFRSIIRLSFYYKTKANRPDLIVSLITLTNLITIIVAKLFSTKIIVQEHNSYLRFMKGRERVTNFTKKYLYRLADVVTVLTFFDVPFYQKHGANVQVMPNPCTFIPISTNEHERENTILAVGSLNRYHHKGFDNLIKLMVPIFKEYPDWKLKIAGSGDEGLKLLTKLAQDYNILDKVVFTGFITNVSEVMNQSSIFILPSRFEGLPMVLLEAMSQGMACIAYNCKTGPSDIIEDSKNGLLVDNQNVEDMQNGLRLLLNSYELRKKLSHQGIKSLDKYNIDTITNSYETLFTKIVVN